MQRKPTVWRTNLIFVIINLWSHHQADACSSCFSYTGHKADGVLNLMYLHGHQTWRGWTGTLKSNALHLLTVLVSGEADDMPTSASACALPWSSLPFCVWEPCSGLWPGKSASVAGSAASSTSGTSSASCAGSLAFPSLTPALNCGHECKIFSHRCFHQQEGCKQRTMLQQVYTIGLSDITAGKISSMHWCQAHAPCQHALCQEHTSQ